jgi:hypothetical protein
MKLLAHMIVTLLVCVCPPLKASNYLTDLHQTWPCHWRWLYPLKEHLGRANFWEGKCHSILKTNFESSVNVLKTKQPHSAFFPSRSYPYKLKDKVTVVRYQVLTAAGMKSTALWDIAPCSLVEVDRRFGDFDKSPWCSTHLWNVGLLRDYTAQYSRRFCLQSNSCVQA